MWRCSRFTGVLVAGLAAPLAACAGGLEDGLAAWQARDYAQAFVLLAPLAEQGVPAAEYVLGEMYRTGKGLVTDPAEAERLLTHAAEAGEVKAQLALAQLFEAEGERQDLGKALQWLRRAAGSGGAEGRFALGLFLIRAEPFRDFGEAARWMRAAAEAGHREAQYFLARLLLDGRGVSANEDEARAWFTEAARQGHVRARRFLHVLARPDGPDRALALRELRRQLAAGTAQLRGVSPDESYGSRENPIRAGSDYGAQWAYLNALRGPHGEIVHYESLGPCCFFTTEKAARGKGFLDRYEVVHEGMAGPAILYFTLFADEARLEAPAGYTFETPDRE